MLMPEAQVRIWLYAPATDMRKSFDGLSALVRQKLAEDPLSGQLFVFLNRRPTQLKILYFDRSGYCVWANPLSSYCTSFSSVRRFLTALLSLMLAARSMSRFHRLHCLVGGFGPGVSYR